MFLENWCSKLTVIYVWFLYKLLESPVFHFVLILGFKKKVTINCQKMSSLFDSISPAGFFYYSLIFTNLANLWDIYLHYRQVLFAGHCQKLTCIYHFLYFFYSTKSTRPRISAQLNWHRILMKTTLTNLDFTILTRAIMDSFANCLACCRNR